MFGGFEARGSTAEGKSIFRSTNNLKLSQCMLPEAEYSAISSFIGQTGGKVASCSTYSSIGEAIGVQPSVLAEVATKVSSGFCCSHLDIYFECMIVEYPTRDSSLSLSGVGKDCFDASLPEPVSQLFS